MSHPTVIQVASQDCEDRTLQAIRGVVDVWASEEGARRLPPPPSAYNRKEKKSNCQARSTEHQLHHDGEMRVFRSSQRRFIRDQIYEYELRPHYSKAESLIHEAAAIMILDVVLNGH